MFLCGCDCVCSFKEVEYKNGNIFSFSFVDLLLDYFLLDWIIYVLEIF